MPSSGTGFGTPITDGTPSFPSETLVQPFPYTLLSVDRFAKIMGITPAHFWGAMAPSVNPKVFPESICASVWKKYAWQSNDKVSRYDLAIEIARAEQDVANVLGYWPAPHWVDNEKLMYPRYYRRDLFTGGGDIRGLAKSVTSKWGKVVKTGQRAVSLVGVASVAGGTLQYLDEDGDGVAETAVIGLATTLTDPTEIKIYRHDQAGYPEFEIREARRKYITGGFFYAGFDSWLLIDEGLWEAYPVEGGNFAVDISTTANFVPSVDVYREYVDTTANSCYLNWENAYTNCAVCNGAGCTVCATIEQGGCLRIRDANQGELAPIPAEYDSDTGEWNYSDWSTKGREPDYVRVYYRAGIQSREFLAGRTHLEMPYDLARVIAHLVTARIERPFCGCSNIQSLAEYLRQDAARSTPAGGMFFTTTDLVNNSFGSKNGEVEAWRALVLMGADDKRGNVAVI